MRRRTRIRPVNTARRKVRYEAAFGPHAEWVRRLPCCVPTCRQGPPSDPAHVRSRAAGGTWRDLVPMCRAHHDEQHRTGIETFQARHGVDLRALAAALANEESE